MESFSLSKLNLYIRRVITLNFQEHLWVSAELLNFKEKNGHVYLELTEKDSENNITAQNSAIIWKSTYANLIKSSQIELQQILREGNEVRLLVAVDYSVRYGLKLIVQNVDASFTLGKISEARMQTIARLKKELIWQKNKSTFIPIAIKNIAVIASKNSAGLKDFENHLMENQFHYTFDITLFNVSVQGSNSASEICHAFEKIKSKKKVFDVIVLIRGGGAKHDLLEFDNYDIAREISLMNTPVLTGIGHFIDESIADLCAFQSLKTPTAVADYILSMNREYELQILTFLESGIRDSKKLISNSIYELSRIEHEIIHSVKMTTYDRYKNLTMMSHDINKWATNLSFEEYKKLLLFHTILESNDPDLILQKGYSLTYKDNVLLFKCDSLLEGEEIKTVYQTGILTSNINRTWEPKK